MVLGTFLELRLSAQPLAAALEHYRALGFHSAPVGDIVPGPYAVVTDGSVALGLGAWDTDQPTPTFVRPDVQSHLRALRRAGAQLEFAALAEDEFHQAGFLDPNGLRIVLVEARTFSPAVAETGNVAVCGRFLELSVASRSIDASQRFWEALGFRTAAAGNAPHRWIRLAGGGLSIGFHETAPFATGLSFVAADLDARLEYMRAKGMAPSPGGPLSAARRGAASLRAPGALHIYMLEQPL